MTQIIHCPTCRAAVDWDRKSPWRPFCSERCKLIDLGAWINEENVIPGVELPEELLSEIELLDDAANEEQKY
ncbi:MAG: DNA gyrase inhibitor YacG [Aquisalimonadaceae bacterium]